MYSLNEIDVTVKRASRGAGLPWGIAEEAAKSARWLEANGLPGAELLLGLLTRIDGSDCHTNSPNVGSDTWTAQSGTLCPLMTGAALSDRADMFAADNELNLGATLSPIILASFAASAASRTGTAIEVSWQGATVTVGPDGVSIQADEDALFAEQAETVRCRSGEATVSASDTRPRVAIPAQVWKTLGEFGIRIFAPDNEASRLAGAGAGLSDND